MVILDQNSWGRRPEAQEVVQGFLEKAKHKRREEEEQDAKRQISLGYCDNVWLSEEDSIIKTELTIEDNPLFVINSFKEKSRHYQRQIRTVDGKILTQQVRVGQRKDSPRAFGVLKEKHQEALYKLIDLWQRTGCKLALVSNRPRAMLATSSYQLAKSLCGNDSSPSYKYTRSIIEDLESIPISIENAFTRNGISFMEFTVLNVEWHGGGSLNRGSSKVVILFSSMITEGFMHGHVKAFSLETYLNLDSSRTNKCSSAKLLHRIFDRELATKEKYNIALAPLMERLGMKRYQHKSQRKQKIAPALASLSNSLIIADTYRVSLELRLSRDGKDYVLVGIKQPKEFSDSHHLELPVCI